MASAKTSAMMLPERGASPVTWQLANEPPPVRRLVRKLEREAAGPVRVFYEVGPCGYALQRQPTTPHVTCEVVAPALIPRKPGEHVKTNQRDARKLVELGRAGLLTPVCPPTPEQEAVRNLRRARDDAGEDLQPARHQLGKPLVAAQSRQLDDGHSACSCRGNRRSLTRGDGPARRDTSSPRSAWPRRRQFQSSWFETAADESSGFREHARSEWRLAWTALNGTGDPELGP